MNRKFLAWRCGWTMALLMGGLPAHAEEAHVHHAPPQAAPGAAPVVTSAISAATATVAATGVKADSVVATVNDQPITRAVLDELARTRAGLPNPYDAETPEEATQREQSLSGIDRKQLLDDLVAMEVLSQQARARGIHTRPAIVAEAELQYKTLLAQQLVRELIAEIEVEPTEVVKRFAEQRPEQMYQVSHILLKDESAARAAITELSKGADFEKVARRRSLDPQSKKDGRLGWLMLNQMEEPFAAAASTLKAGDYTRQPVVTTSGWHVIRVNAKRELNKPSLEDSWDILRTQVLQEKVQARVRQLTQEARVDVARPQGSAQ